MVKTEIVEINREKHPFYIGFNALRVYKKTTGQDLIAQMQTGNLQIGTEEIIGLAHCGLTDGYRMAKKPFDKTLDEVADMLDTDVDSITKIFEAVSKFPIFNTEGKPNSKKK